MRILVRVKPRAKTAGVEKLEGQNYIVSVKSPPIEGKANKEVIDVLADYFGVAKSKVSIIKGETGRIKMVEIGN
ncbi:MAG: DUF167 domain-containing protein [bacterium]|nr:DUF167 domain-containing protein [bacterium]